MPKGVYQRPIRTTVQIEAAAEKTRLRNKAWKQANRDRVLARRRIRENTDAERARKLAWALQHRPDLKRLALKAGAATNEPIDYAAVLKRADGKCGICAEAFDASGIEFDHIVPLSKGGAHCESNIQAAHKFCNRSKGNKLIA